METNITVELALVNGKPPLRALADVTLSWSDGGLTLRRFAVFEKPDQFPWASVPRLQVGKEGRRAYVPLLDLPTGLRRRVLGAVLAEYKRLTNEK